MKERDTETTQQLNALYTTWDRERIRGWYNPTLRRLPRVLARLGRTIIRVGQLGRIFDAQAALYRALLSHETQLESRSLEFDATIQTLRDRLIALQELLAVLETHAQQTDHQFQQIQATQQQFVHRSDLLTQLTELNTRLAMLEQYPTQLAELSAQLDRRLSAFMENQEPINEQVKLNTSYLRLLEQQREIEHTNESVPTPFLPSAELINVIELLEAEFPDLAQCTAIELSIQDSLAESAVASGAAYFGKRMSSSGETYRVPNDAWYHIDFTPQWNRKLLFDSAATRLARDGYLIIVTLPEHADIGSTNPLEVVADRTLSLSSGKDVRVYMLRMR